jgi:CHAD domain-containing protein
VATSLTLKPSSNTTTTKSSTPKPKLGLRAWMERVLEECDRADKDFDVDAVHDLRVALRRCRSLADGMIPIDPDSSWKEMKKAGRKIFRELGDLRDMQVMEEWIEKIASAHDVVNDPVAAKLLVHLKSREAEYKQLARRDLGQFNRKQWRQWGKTLPQRASRVRPGSLVYLHLALEKWMEAYELHKRVLRTRSTVGWHELRIAIKHFRYTVENFLPQQHARWGGDLKELQDLLGEVHDLDVLWSTAIDSGVDAFPDVESRKRWRENLNLERNKRIARYRAKMVGKQSLWRQWRAELPSGPQLRAAATSRLRTWVAYLDPDFSNSQRVAQVSQLLYDQLKNAGFISGDHAPAANSVTHRSLPEAQAALDSDADPRFILQAAALAHDVGRAKGSKNHQKKSYKMIRALNRPLGYSARELDLAATVARYHRGALPRPRGKIMQRLAITDRPVATLLAAILRLAVALAACQQQNVRKRNIPSRGLPSSSRPLARLDSREKRIEVHFSHDQLLVRLEGYSAFDRSAQEIAAARHLLETVLRRPIMVRPLRAAAALAKTPLRQDESAQAIDEKGIRNSGKRTRATGSNSEAA